MQKQLLRFPDVENLLLCQNEWSYSAHLNLKVVIGLVLDITYMN